MYGGIGVFFTVKNPETKDMLEAAFVGGMLADYLTWLIRSIAMFPSYVWHGCYDMCVNVIFGWFLFCHTNVAVNINDPSYLCVEFTALLLVAAIKISFYSLKYVAATVDDDDDD